MLLMLCVLMMVINASKERGPDDYVPKNKIEVSELSERPTLRQKIRTFQIWTLRSILFNQQSFPLNITQLIFSYLSKSSERPILKSQFQKARTFQIWILRSILLNQLSFPLHIVQRIFSYLAFAPRSTKVYCPDLVRGVISRDGHLFLSTDLNYLYLSDLGTGERIRTFAPPYSTAFSVCAIADSHAYVAGSCEQEIYLWCTISGALIKLLKGHTDNVISISFFLNDRRIASGSHDKTVRVWLVESTHCLFVLHEAGMNTFNTIVVSSDNTLIFSMNAEDQSIRVWDSVTGICLRVLPTNGGNTSRGGFFVKSVDDDRCLGSIGRDNETKLWNTTTGKCTKTIASIHVGPPNGYDLCYVSSKRVVWWNFVKIGVWDLETDANIYIIPRRPGVHFKFVGVSADNKYLIAVLRGDKGTVMMEVYSFETGILII